MAGTSRINIGLDKSGYQVNVFLFLNENISCGYSLEVPCRGASNEYPQHMFSSINKKNIDIFWLKKAPYQKLQISFLCNLYHSMGKFSK